MFPLIHSNLMIVANLSRNLLLILNFAAIYNATHMHIGAQYKYYWGSQRRSSV